MNQSPANDYTLANQYDLARAMTYDAREADWRIGPVIYHVLVDRFAPADRADLAHKSPLYAAPRKLRDWSEVPSTGTRIEELGCWSHELDFWGGDLTSLRTKLDYIRDLGTDVLYLNPIHAALTNHKYDAQDYAAVSPEYGTRADVAHLATDTHAKGMKLMLDGVFNHMGKSSPMFQQALADPSSPYRSWFSIGPEFRHGYRGWANVANLPEINLEHPDVRKYIWDGPQSVVRSLLREGVDGWRLDVGYDLGFVWLAELTKAAHAEKPGSAVIGEIWNYPEEWMPALDGVMNFHARQIVLDYLEGKLSGARAGRLLHQMIDDTGIDAILRCWMVLDNHDTARLRHWVPDQRVRRMARTLQFTLPGAPCVYYGTEVDMEGGDDPANRAPMRWDLATPDNADMLWFKSLVELRKSSRALRIGDFRLLDSESLLAFQRRTDRWSETVFVVANATALPVTEVVSLRDSKVMNYAPLIDAFTRTRVEARSGLIEVDVPPHTVMVLKPEHREGSEYSPYKRVQ